MRPLAALVCFTILGAAAWAQPASLGGFEDQGTFVRFADENRVGVLTFKWLRDGHFNASQTMTMSGRTIETSTEVLTDSSGAWIRINSVTPLGPLTIERQGAEATMRFEDKTTKFHLKPNSILFANYAPALTALAIRNYDAKKGGRQPFPALIVGDTEEVEASLERTGSFQRTIGGRDLTFTRYTLRIPELDLFLCADADGRVYLVDVPEERATFVRDGYESLRRP